MAMEQLKASTAAEATVAKTMSIIIVNNEDLCDDAASGPKILSAVERENVDDGDDLAA